jgi:uncharacterized DUF497 family protein
VNIEGIIWLAEVEDKIISKHSIWPEEVEQALEAHHHVRFMEKGHRAGEDLYVTFGQTEAGRYLAVYYMVKRSSDILIVTARDMTAKEKRTYGKR